MRYYEPTVHLPYRSPPGCLARLVATVLSVLATVARVGLWVLLGFVAGCVYGINQ